jgi:hypothetical protein
MGACWINYFQPRVIAVFRAVLQLPQIILKNLDKSKLMRTFGMSKYLP